MTDVLLAQPTAQLPTPVGDQDETQKADFLEQFYLTLNVMYLAAPRIPGSPVHDRIDRLVADARSWRNAYEIEQLLCFVLTDQQLETELQRRLAEGKTLKLPYVDVIDKELHESNVEPSVKRIVLHRLLNDLQWFYTKRAQHRAAGKRLMWRVSHFFFGALIWLFVVLFVQFYAQGQPGTGQASQPPSTVQDSAAPDGTQRVGGQ